MAQSYVHCEMCGYLWKLEDWTPASECPTCTNARELAWLEAVWQQFVLDGQVAA